ncbi:mitochondrial carrier domain-containing protein [Schizophyllum amplum]|uniref:Mitochondrial carrier domain-containing protein n=1 Tax=Schizophyllum amplum TaxID=97359 RepID=A0A550CSJ1_9AGAR|nr:mitochondrial carrier domain-containing protein [Auriculariopsis ampla]
MASSSDEGRGATSQDPSPHTRRQAYDSTMSGAQRPPYLPPLRSDQQIYRPLPHTLEEFRQQEGKPWRKKRLQDLYHRLLQSPPEANHDAPDGQPVDEQSWTPERAQRLKSKYDAELYRRCGGHIGWRAFKEYAESKEEELWAVFHEQLDLDGNGHLDAAELNYALRKAGIKLDPLVFTDLMTTLTSSSHSSMISFADFRDFLLLLPVKVSTAEIYRYYEVRKVMGDDGRGPARVNMEGDVSLSAEDKPPDSNHQRRPADSVPSQQEQRHDDDMEEDWEEVDEEEEEAEDHHILAGYTALRFLLAGGIAGAVSRTCTAPFDRLKIFLITRPPDLGGVKVAGVPTPGYHALRTIFRAASRIYVEGGVLGFWTGNGLSVAKIFPESAIKFFTYESAKRFFATYVDHVDDSRNISGTSRFLSGGLGGISAQLSIYPIETLKTQMMSNTGDSRRTLKQAVTNLWTLGGYRAFYRGLTIGLIGVFPYSAIDMSTFEALKLAYMRSTGHDPSVLSLLAFGSVSGSIGATSVYPLNLVRTRLQASGSSGHPQKYTGVQDVIITTYNREGWRGFYRGLFPTLAKVIPSVSISYVVYEHSKKKLGV